MISEDEQKRFINTVKKACDFFRNVRVWPLETNLDYEGWISNFIGTQDQYLASLILCNFIYYPQAMIRKLLYDAVGNACGYFKKSDFCWQHDHHKRRRYIFPVRWKIVLRPLLSRFRQGWDCRGGRPGKAHRR